MECEVLRIQFTLLTVVFACTVVLGLENEAKHLSTKFNTEELPVRRKERDVRVPYNVTVVEEFNGFNFNTEKPRETVEMFCPSSVLCSSDNVSASVTDQDNHCCIPCEWTGTCCGEVNSSTQYPEENLHTDLNETCVETYIGDIESQNDVRDTGSYWLIKYCPVNSMQDGEDDTQKRCIRPEADTLEEIVPVYSKETKRNYGNIFCAICNNDTITILPWESNFVCRNKNNISLLLLDMLIPNEIGRTNSAAMLQAMKNTEGCILKWKPTFGKVNVCIDQDRVISECIDTALSTKKLENLCHEINSPVIGQFGLYRNVFCLACNEGQTVFNSLCNKEGPTDVRDLQTSFTTVLALELYIDKPDPTKIMNLARCKDEMSYDETLKRCIQKTCPISQVQAGDRCFPMLKTMKGISLDYRLKLIYSFSSFYIFRKEHVFAEVNHFVLHNMGRICAEKLTKIEHQGEHMVVHLQLTKTLDDFDSHLEQEIELFKQNIRNELAKEGKGYTVEMDNSPFEPIYTGYINYGVYSDYNFHEECGSSVAVSSIQTCNTVLVTKFHSQEGGSIVISGQTFLPGEYIISINPENTEQRSVQICYDVYVTRMMSAPNQFNVGRCIEPLKPLKGAFIILTSLFVISFT